MIVRHWVVGKQLAIYCFFLFISTLYFVKTDFNVLYGERNKALAILNCTEHTFSGLITLNVYLLSNFILFYSILMSIMV